jgi:hypothetical protein
MTRLTHIRLLECGSFHRDHRGCASGGVGDEVGSLEAGQQADLLRWCLQTPALDLTELTLAPVRNADGVRAEAAVRAEAQVQAEEVARRVAADPAHEEMALLGPMANDQL